MDALLNRCPLGTGYYPGLQRIDLPEISLICLKGARNRCLCLLSSPPRLFFSSLPLPLTSTISTANVAVVGITNMLFKFIS